MCSKTGLFGPTIIRISYTAKQDEPWYLADVWKTGYNEGIHEVISGVPYLGPWGGSGLYLLNSGRSNEYFRPRILHSCLLSLSFLHSNKNSLGEAFDFS